MGKGVYIVSSRTNCLELKEFMEILSLRSKKNPLEKILPQLSKGREIAVHLENIDVNPDNEESYLLNGRFESNVQSIAEQLGNLYDVKHGIQPISKSGIIYSIKYYAVLRKKR